MDRNIQRSSTGLRVYWLAAAVSLASISTASVASDAEIEFIGSYNNIDSGDNGEHCTGQPFDLWKHDHRIIGLFTEQMGPCGDPPCQAFQLPQDPKDPSKLMFDATLLGRRHHFSGKWSTTAVVGKWDKKTVVVPKQATESSIYESHQSLDSWCESVGTVSRCTGVKDICK